MLRMTPHANSRSLCEVALEGNVGKFSRGSRQPQAAMPEEARMNSVCEHSVASSSLVHRLFSLAAALAPALLAALIMTMDTARGFDDSLYPNLKGQWLRVRPPAGVRGQGPFDPDKSWGLAQQAPLTPEYQAIFEASATGHSHPRFCVVTFKSAGVPERSASNERR